MNLATLKIPVIILHGLLFLSGLLISTGYAEPLIWSPPGLASLIIEGLENNKEIQSLNASVKSLKERAEFAGALNDPRVGIGVLNLPTDSFRFDEQPMTQKQVFVAQKIPWFGKLSLKSQDVLLMAERQEAVLLAKRLETARKIATDYYQLGFIHYSLEINRQLADMMEQVLRIAETRYSSGQGLQQDIFQAQVEISRLTDEKITLENKRRMMENRINGLLNRERFKAIEPPMGMTYSELNYPIADLQALALKQNPWIRVKAIERDQAKIRIELADKEYWPDVDVKIAYGQRDEVMGNDLADFVSASMTMNIPLWQNSRQDKNRASVSASHEAAVKAYKHLAESLPYKVDALYTEILSLQESYRLYRDTLISQTTEWANSSLAGYQVGNMEFNTMMNAQIRLLRSREKAESYLFSIYRKQAELEELLGGPLRTDQNQASASEDINAG